MKTKLALIVIVLGALALEQAALAKGGGRGGGGGGGKGGGGGGPRPQVSRPGGGGGGQKISKPAGGSASFRPSGGGGQKNSKPSGGGGGRLPQGNKPEKRPDFNRPAGSGGGLPSFSGGGKPKLPDRASNLPGKVAGNENKPNLPDRGSKLPDRKPGGGDDFLGLRPDKPGGKDRPGFDRPDGGKPERPSNLPNNIADKRPGGGDRPGFANRPGAGGGGEQFRPGNNHDFNPDRRPGHPDRPARPDRPEKWQNVHNNNQNQWNQWKQNNHVQINNFQVNRTNNWNRINTRYNERDWPRRYGSAEYRSWRNNVWDFRRDRCEEIWSRRQGFWDDCFDNHWWSSCWWRRRPFVAVGVSPWWWWRPFAWAGAGVFFGATIAAEPIVYDPGTTVIYEGDTYYVDGEPSGTAAAARQQAIQLANPAVAEIPVPDPAPEGQPETWLPLGVWALTQEEQGDATMFMQFSVDKNGLIGGAYKNVMTGDEQPIVGQLDRKTQRIAWHVGNATQTVYETGFSSLQNDVLSVFVHFGEAQTQTWLLVHLPSPEMPPGTVKLPDLKKE